MMEYIYLESVGSTNDYSRSLLSEGRQDSGIVVVCSEAQTKGRGQRGNSWESERGKNLTFSVVCHPVSLEASEQFVLSQSMALSILDTLIAVHLEQASIGKKHNGVFSVKWPNDIYYGDRKICGTLIECDLCGKMVSNCIIGSGLNVNQSEFFSDAPNPVSLYQIYNEEFDLKTLLKEICERFEHYLHKIDAGDFQYIRDRYIQHLYRHDGLFPYRDKNGLFLAKIKGIENSGRLVLETEEGDERRYEFKEVSFVIR